ncbi:MAG TPA: tetratricopeptide repeat protein [Salinimicrobium sp.]|nr:tetratricopeptide repeat protein [Salinimicrobium sp.]
MKNADLKNNFVLKALFSVFMFLILIPVSSAQEDQEKAIREAKKYMQKAEEAVNEENFASAEALYRQAIAKDPTNATARYNLGNLYMNKEIIGEAVERHTQAAAVASRKPVKHNAFHNKGNAFMEQKKYKEAIEAYKNSLRNNPEDDETRYNLALAKDLWEEEQKNGQDKNDKEQNKGENEDEKKDDKQQGDKGEQDPKKDGEPKDDKGDKKDQQKKEGGEQEEKQPPKQPQDKGDKGGEKNENKQKQPVPGQLSPQQVKNLLEAMSNQEKQVREKINAEKAKGAKVKTGKDW